MAKFKKKRTPPLRYLPLGGAGEVTRNMHVYEYGSDIVIVDCGIGFPDMEALGVDVVVPDISYLRDKIKNIRGILITHGHEDHFGALPYLLPELDNPPVYATRLVQGFIRDKLQDFNLLSGSRLCLIDPDTPFKLGKFQIETFRINHSVPDSVGFKIDTPEGRLIHLPDFKIDWTPVQDPPFELNKVAGWGEEGVDILFTDSLGSTHEGFTKSERELEPMFEVISRKAQGRQLFLSTVSSNIGRMQQAIDAGLRYGREHGVLVGWSIRHKAKIAEELGYLKVPKGYFLDARHLRKRDRTKLLFIVSGCYGQTGSSMDRLARGEHRVAELQEGDVVVFSGDPAPPGSRASVDAVVDQLSRLGADVHYYDFQEDPYVSGHACIEEMKLLLAVSKPQYVVPISSTPRQTRAYAVMAESLGWPSENVLGEFENGHVLEFRKGKLSRGKNVPVQKVFVDGFGMGEVGAAVLRDRQELADDGVVVLVLPVKKKTKELADEVRVVSRGFVYAREAQDLLDEIGAAGGKAIHAAAKEKMKELGKIRRKVESEVSTFILKETNREPVILPVIVEV